MFFFLTMSGLSTMLKEIFIHTYIHICVFDFGRELHSLDKLVPKMVITRAFEVKFNQIV